MGYGYLLFKSARGIATHREIDESSVLSLGALEDARRTLVERIAGMRRGEAFPSIVSNVSPSASIRINRVR